MFNKRTYMFLFFLFLSFILGAEQTSADDSIYKKRMSLYKKTEAVTQIPWYYIAAIDQYERNTEKDTSNEKVISISFPDELWYGLGNSAMITDQDVIAFFSGIGKDGNGDKKADPGNPEDALFTMANWLLSYGPTKDDIKIGLWHYYKRDLTVQTIMSTAKVFQQFQKLNLKDRDFPVSIKYNYSYRSTWGDRRGFGGVRIHEGTDIFAGYGTPVKSTTYGVIEMKGWNLYGGWRLGIRDINNIYHYYGHLSGYDDKIKVGQVVKPGDVLGSVGSTGYGPPGTSGKFPPHLHYGMYKDNGYSEWSFDPYPYLRKWERMARQK
ncbi:peptidoglycan DD-metalloendopeptidase family protein [Virgibacillus dakarensis]|uniref:L-Ala--D-Glu endopeptidase n=1 Tax=Lentibacillus populi TaxID=1827502 RepID=A0A9W5X4S7_9BACI|nr:MULTISPECIES: M23 family metallopeptidase [Bacillaceae]MBT2217102.1 M23 family metallopeptidase [Virgibacillus dakarensis]MTW84698.1 peptidoglycan DD-metalloendopeptidase family protein [Virgibacillus dakarensis]GGB36529.1 L-Ala--D-Glu endopeptidase [Lentibacillus populi]